VAGLTAELGSLLSDEGKRRKLGDAARNFAVSEAAVLQPIAMAIAERLPAAATGGGAT